MCLVLFAYQANPRQTLVVAANRDELYARDAAAAHYWETEPALLAGRDLSAGGTWLGVSATGRFATVTNFAEAAAPVAPLSRGALTRDFLLSEASCHDYVQSIDPPAYRGFNLLLWDGETLVCTSNTGQTQTLSPGIYGLTNAEFGARWPKVLRGTAALQQCVASGAEVDELLTLLNDDVTPPDHELPQRGRPLEIERQLASCFIRGEEYGTRASTAVVLSKTTVEFAEQGYGPRGQPGARRNYCFSVSAAQADPATP
jgi:uncharacterized protein with NRDE domain